MGYDRGEKDQKGKKGKDEVVRQRRGKRHGVILLHVANHIHGCLLEVECPHGSLHRDARDPPVPSKRSSLLS